MANTRKRKQAKDDSPFPAPSSMQTAQATSHVRTRAQSAPKKDEDVSSSARTQLGSPFEDAPQHKQGDGDHGSRPDQALDNPYMRHHNANALRTGSVGPEYGAGPPQGSPSVFAPSNSFQAYRQPSQLLRSVGHYGQQHQASFAGPYPPIATAGWKSPGFLNMSPSPTPPPKGFPTPALGVPPVPFNDISEHSARGGAGRDSTLTPTIEGPGLQHHTSRVEAPSSVPRYVDGGSGQVLEQILAQSGQAGPSRAPTPAPQPLQNVPQQALTREEQEVANRTLAMQQWMTTNHPPSSQPWPRRPPMNISNRRIPDSQTARDFLNHASWRPISKSHGVPRTEEDRLPYVKKIYDALVDTSNVWDSLDWPQDARRFDADVGVWGRDARIIEAISHQIVDVCIKIHDHGVTGLDMALFPGLQEKSQQDLCFQFAQRIHFMAVLLRHFKFKANQVMLSCSQVPYLARIWSELRDQKEFWTWWESKPETWRMEQIHVEPSEGVPAVKMTREDEKMALVEAHQEKVAREQRKLEYQRQLHQQKEAEKQGSEKRPLDAVESPSGAPAEKRPAIESSSGQPGILRPSLFGPFPTQQQLVGQGQVNPPEVEETVESGATDAEAQNAINMDNESDWDALSGD